MIKFFIFGSSSFKVEEKIFLYICKLRIILVFKKNLFIRRKKNVIKL